MTAYVLLLPLLLPAASAFAARKKADPKLLTGLMVLELALVLLGCLTEGSFSVPCLPGMVLLFQADMIGKIFSVLFATMFLLSGIFGFEYLHFDSERYYCFYLLTCSAMLGLCYAGNLLTFYLFYEAMTLLSFPLVLHERTEASRRAAMKYLGYSLFGAALALFGFFVVYPATDAAAFRPGGCLTGPVSPLLLAAALAMIIGFGG